MDDRTKKKIAMFANDISSDADKELRHTRGQVRETLEGIIRKAELIRVLTRDEDEQKADVVSMMRRLFAEEEIETATELAEATADELEMHEVLDDPNHPIWDWAIEVVEEGPPGDDR